MSVGSFLSASFLVLGGSMAPPASGDHAQMQFAQNETAPPAMEQGATTLTRNTPTQVNGIETVCTGVDSDTRADPRWAAYSLRLEFTAGGRAYVSDETVTITGAHGVQALQVHCPGAWVLAKLNPGKYSVSATVQGATKHASVTVPKTGQARAVLRFPEVPAAESTTGQADPNSPAAPPPQ